MSPRVAGAALALLAAVMLVASLAGIPAGWWSGHPIRNGEAMHKKDIDISMLRAIGCDTGGDGHCEPLGSELGGTFAAVRYVELGASGILVLTCLLLAGVTFAASERRKPLGKLVIAMGLVSATVAGALIFLPKVKSANIELPVGPGLFVFFGGVACALLGSIFAMRPTPKLELQPPRQSFAPGLGAPPTAQPVDVLAMLQPEARPAQPDPMPSRPPPSPGGQLAGPAGPLVPPGFGSTPPRFGSAPYSVPTAPAFTPPEHAPTNLPPTPFPAAPFSPRPGGSPLATPPPPDAHARARSGTGAPPLPGVDRTRSSSPMPAIPGERPGTMPALPGDRLKASGTAPALPGVDRSKAGSVAPPNADARTKAASMPPPTAEARIKPASIAPPSGDLRAKAANSAPPFGNARVKAASVPPPAADARSKPASVPPPAAARTKPASVPPPGAPPTLGPIPSTVAGMMAPSRPSATDLTTPRTKGPSVPPPGGKKPTTVSAIVPPPPAGPLLSTMLPIRAHTDASDQLETMSRDAMTIARDGAPAISVGRPLTDASIGDSTDASVALPDSGAAEETTDIGVLPIEPMEPRDSASEIQTSMQRKLTASELVRTVARESQSEIETIAREKFSASDLAIGDSTNPAILADAHAEAGRRSAKEIKELGEAPTAPARVGISTASQSLPPPKKAEVATSGPTPACPQCEAPMAWVEEHLRFYCKSCRMYF